MYIAVEALRNAASIWLSVWTATTDSAPEHVPAASIGSHHVQEPVRDILVAAVTTIAYFRAVAASKSALYYLGVYCIISLVQVCSAVVWVPVLCPEEE